MFAAVLFVHQQNTRRVIPLQWIYNDNETLTQKKHFLAFFNFNDEAKAPPKEFLSYNNSKDIRNNELHKIFVYKILRKNILLLNNF